MALTTPVMDDRRRSRVSVPSTCDNNEMRGRWKHPKRSLDWYNGTKRAFAEVPED